MSSSNSLTVKACYIIALKCLGKLELQLPANQGPIALMF